MTAICERNGGSNSVETCVPEDNKAVVNAIWLMGDTSVAVPTTIEIVAQKNTGESCKHRNVLEDNVQATWKRTAFTEPTPAILVVDEGRGVTRLTADGQRDCMRM